MKLHSMLKANGRDSNEVDYRESYNRKITRMT